MGSLCNVLAEDRSGVLAAVPAGGFDFVLDNGADVDLGFEPVEHRAQTEVLAREGGCAGPGTAVALADHLGEEVDAAAEIRFVAEVERPAAVAATPGPIGVFLRDTQA